MAQAPNRSGGRRRRNTTDENGVSTVPRKVIINGVDWVDGDGEGSSENLVPAPKPNDDWHEVAKLVFAGLEQSAQRVFYEPSDWAIAYLACDHISRELEPKFVGFKKTQDGETEKGIPVLVDEPHFETMPLTSGSLQGILKALEKILASELDRRKARVEIERGAVAPVDAGPGVVQSRLELIQGTG